MKYEYGSNLEILWAEDPKMLGVRLARYKFVAKMFQGFGKVLEVGAGSGFLSKVVAQSVAFLDLTDANPENGIRRWDPLKDATEERYDGVYALDVLEHVDPKDSDRFVWRLASVLKDAGCAIIGMPSIESQAHASRKSMESHINCMSEDGLKELMRPHFRTVFMFGMNDEVVHTGFGPMCHYRIALGVK